MLMWMPWASSTLMKAELAYWLPWSAFKIYGAP